jgi:protein-S-isoprenylcysteine O-methyltransferase Ste14
MSIFPKHSLDFFNLWLLMALYSLPIIITILFKKRVFQSTASRFSSSKHSSEYNLFVFSKVMMLFYFLYAIFVPIQYNSLPAIIGIAIYFAGFILYSAAWRTIATSERRKVFSQGVYQYSRHPVYVSSAVMFIGAGLISLTWLFLCLSVVVGISHMYNAFAEEKTCLEAFGDEYRNYMSKTPRWFGWPKR